MRPRVNESRLTISNLNRVSGYWTAEVTPAGSDTVYLTRQWGSWMAIVNDKLVEPAALGLPHAPARLEEIVWPIEQREARERERLAEIEKKAAQAAQKAEAV